MTHRVEVDLALQRPPRVDVTVTVLLSEADYGPLEAELVAIELASLRSVRMPFQENQRPRVKLPAMAVGSRYTRVHDDC